MLLCMQTFPWNSLAWFWVFLFRSQEGFFDKEKVSGGRFQGFWNLLIRHHYIKIILIKWECAPLVRLSMVINSEYVPLRSALPGRVRENRCSLSVGRRSS